MAVDLNSLQKAYQRYSHVYDLIFGAVFHPGRRSAIEHLHCKAGDRVLEVGVGTGLSLPLYPDGVTVTGIDLSKEMLAKAKLKVTREHLTHVESLQVMDAQDMSFADNTFDRVVAMYVASVIPDRKTFVAEVKRVCKPGGIIIFLNHFQSKNPILKKAENLASPLAKVLGFYTDIPLDSFVEETGFTVDQVIPANAFGYWTILIGENHKSAT